MSRRRKPLLERFASMGHVVSASGCWLWTRAKRNGYGVLGRGGRNDGVEYAHRVAWMSTRGEIPAGMDVCHSCDTRECVNPSHLFIGTRQDNVNDMMAKGRHWRQRANS